MNPIEISGNWDEISEGHVDHSSLASEGEVGLHIVVDGVAVTGRWDAVSESQTGTQTTIQSVSELNGFHRVEGGHSVSGERAR